ncbi:uncharacterized protein F5147DRAFT_661690, partial [Suillus discolor]
MSPEAPTAPMRSTAWKILHWLRRGHVNNFVNPAREVVRSNLEHVQLGRACTPRPPSPSSQPPAHDNDFGDLASDGLHEIDREARTSYSRLYVNCKLIKAAPGHTTILPTTTHPPIMPNNHDSGSLNHMSYRDIAQALDEPIMLTTDIKGIPSQSTATGQPQLKVQIINPLASLFPDAQESPPVHLVPNSAVPIFSSIVSSTVKLAAHMENTSNGVAGMPGATDVSKGAKKKEVTAPKQTTIRATAKSLCRTDWCKDNPNGSNSQFETHWRKLEPFAKQ